MVNMSETVPGNMLPGKIIFWFFETQIFWTHDNSIAYNDSGAVGVPEIPQWWMSLYFIPVYFNHNRLIKSFPSTPWSVLLKKSS